MDILGLPRAQGQGHYLTMTGCRKKAVEAEPKFDFLMDKVASIPDPQQADPEKSKKPRKPKKEEFVVPDDHVE